MDATGHGSVSVQPGFYQGAKGGNATSVVARDGQDLGTAFLTRGGGIACEGYIDVTADPNSEVFLYFNWD